MQTCPPALISSWLRPGPLSPAVLCTGDNHAFLAGDEMRHPLKNNPLSRTRQKFPQSSHAPLAVIARAAIAFTFSLASVGSVAAQDTHFVLDRDGRTIVLEPYAPNILRITITKDKDS